MKLVHKSKLEIGFKLKRKKDNDFFVIQDFLLEEEKPLALFTGFAVSLNHIERFFASTGKDIEVYE